MPRAKKPKAPRPQGGIRTPAEARRFFGVSPGATKETIQKEYRAFVLKHHPDRNPKRVREAEEMLKKANAAWDVLKTAYDW